MRGSPALAALCAILMALPAQAQTGTPTAPSGRVGGINARSPAAEFYTTDPDAGILARIHIWGDVGRPGVYFINEKANFVEAISMAGGPTPTAKVDGVRVQRGTEIRYIDLLGDSGTAAIRAGDTIYLERSFKSDLPLIYGTIGTALSLAAFYLAFSRVER